MIAVEQPDLKQELIGPGLKEKNGFSINTFSKVSALVAIKALNEEPSPPGSDTDPG